MKRQFNVLPYCHNDVKYIVWKFEVIRYTTFKMRFVIEMKGTKITVHVSKYLCVTIYIWCVILLHEKKCLFTISRF